MKKDTYFKDQKFVLLYMYFPAGMFMDETSSAVESDECQSLVISGRSNFLESPGSFLDKPGVMDFQEDPVTEEFKQWICDSMPDWAFPAGKPEFEYKSLWWDHHKYDADEDLLERYGKKKFVEIVRCIGTIGDRPFADRLIVLAYDDGTDFDSNDDGRFCVLLKRGGYELVVEYMLSAFNEGGSAYGEELNLVRDIVCDDGSSRSFNFSLKSNCLDELNSSEYDIDYDSYSGYHEYENKRAIFNINEEALKRLKLMFTAPVHPGFKSLTNEQRLLYSQSVQMFEQSVQKGLMELSDFIGLELFNQQLPKIPTAECFSHG